ncbi:MAG: MotA/TolQ/ExbB proton channel family protein [Brevinematales bacterium]|jgi:biopolymer transport protein ExbB
MFAGKTLWDFLQMGLYTMTVLVICSIISLTFILERAYHIRSKTRVKRPAFMSKIKSYIESNSLQGAVAYAGTIISPLARVVQAGLLLVGKSDEKITNAMDRQISIEVKELEKYTGIIGSIGSTVVYIGLFGTVLGIIKAFQDIASAAGSGTGITGVVAGIAEALITTASGIAVAVPSVIAYNTIMNKIDTMSADMEICASETLDLLRK